MHELAAAVAALGAEWPEADVQSPGEPTMAEAPFDLGDTLHFQFEGGAPTEPPRTMLPPVREPEFLRRARAEERWQRPWVRAALTAALGLCVALGALQAAWTWRDSIAARWSAGRGALAWLCRVGGCTLQAPRNPADLVLETSAMAPAADGTLRLDATLHNRGETPVAYPALELSLSDSHGRLLVRKVIEPAGYLEAGAQRSAGLGAGDDAEVHLLLKLTHGRASGYQLYAFYP